ncbi:hypothetical protein M758_12G109100 [Ceratodon purpureus]|nr:hypothetical protein M758_12G109100 [Ceratodon purpureus]
MCEDQEEQCLTCSPETQSKFKRPFAGSVQSQKSLNEPHPENLQPCGQVMPLLKFSRGRVASSAGKRSPPSPSRSGQEREDSANTRQQEIETRKYGIQCWRRNLDNNSAHGRTVKMTPRRRRIRSLCRRPKAPLK